MNNEDDPVATAAAGVVAVVGPVDRVDVEVGAAGGAAVVPHVPSSPLWTQTWSPVERTVPGLVARISIEPVELTVSAATPSPPVVALASPAVTVAPAAGDEPPLPSRVTTLTS